MSKIEDLYDKAFDAIYELCGEADERDRIAGRLLRRPPEHQWLCEAAQMLENARESNRRQIKIDNTLGSSV